MSEPKKTCREK
jgi:hypothetical protein